MNMENRQRSERGHQADTIYASTKMQERRRVVMEATRALIAEHGLEKFSMRQLAQRAGVSPSTLFNIYGNRDHLIGLAVADAFHATLGDLVTDAPTNVSELEAYIRWTAREIVALGHYVDVIVGTYFSRANPNPVRELLRRETEAPYRCFLDALGRSADADFISMMIANHIFATMHVWSLGEVTDADLANILVRGVTVILYGSETGPVQSGAQPSGPAIE